MANAVNSGNGAGGASGTDQGYRFRVSDTVNVPLRGVMLRLKLMEGRPVLDRLEPGQTIRLVAPDGEVRRAQVKALGVTGGRTTQARLERNRQLDVLISPEVAGEGGRPIDIGWYVVGD